MSLVLNKFTKCADCIYTCLINYHMIAVGAMCRIKAEHAARM